MSPDDSNQMNTDLALVTSLLIETTFLVSLSFCLNLVK